ncbi:transcriptional regulator [Pseudonocardia sp. CNS-139]|nr:transcriptional regulator [Pseudonocardia sp. CNS-139]
MEHEQPVRVLLTVEAAAERLSISRTRMYALIKDEEISSVKVGRLRRVPLDSLHEFTRRLISAQQTTSTSGS